MQKNRVFGSSNLIRVFSAFLFVVVTLANSDCRAQQRRGLFRRNARVQQEMLPQEILPQATRSMPVQSENAEAASLRRFPAASRYFDPRNLQSWDPGSGDPRYIGGFHYTHFQNIGIPSGDIGLRGNAYHWRPW